MPKNRDPHKSKSGRYSPWFRMYVEILDDIKVHRLSGNHFKAWVRCLALAKLNGGVLPGIEEIAYRLRMSHEDASAYVDELILGGFLDVRPDGCIEPHNWTGRQFVWDGPDPTVRDRVRRHRARASRSCNGRRNGPVTVDVTELPSESVSVSAVECFNLSIHEEGNSTLEGSDTREVLP